jgi:hypothetical protein
MAFTSNLCGYANCYLEYDKVLGTFDWGVNNGLPIVIIILANIALVVRVIKQKRRRQQHPNSRKNQRRMTLQLLRISSLYLISWLPSLIIGVGQQLISPNFLAELQSDYALDLIYLVCLFLPWVSLRLLPECTKWIRKQMHCGRTPRNIVRPK